MRATLIDVFTRGKIVTLWLRAGSRNLYLNDWVPLYFFVGGTPEQLNAVPTVLKENIPSTEFTVHPVQRKELEPNNEMNVLKITLSHPRKRRSVIRLLEQKFRFQLSLYNTDIEIDRLYLFQKNVRPFQEVEVMASNGWIQGIRPVPFSPFIEQFPSLKTARLELVTKGTPDAPFPDITAIRFGNLFFRGPEKSLLMRFKDYFCQFNADIILTRRGNKQELSLLKKKMRFYRIPFKFGKFADYFPRSMGKSYHSYGRVVRHEPAHYLRGRLHIQMADFHFKEAGIEGIFEIAHTTVMPIQKAARLGSGNCISNLVQFHAFRKGYLIPHNKVNVEQFKNAWHLFEMDKGGLVYEPLPGLHENVVEMDFSSLYPSIIVNHNISAETMNCSCCTASPDPLMGYPICRKRKGIMGEVLKPLIDRRLYYKRLRGMVNNREHPYYAKKCNALKWLLVVCFGYMGYKNHRFGRIEAHQAICAFAREKLIEAAHLAEARGFTVVHGYVDALYLTKKPFDPRELETLSKEIEARTGIEITLDGLFKWFCVLPRIQDARINTPTRFYGLYHNGELKLRGIQVRRKDTPPAIFKMQQEQLHILSKTSDAAQFEQRIPLLFGKMREWIGKLQNNLIPLPDLAFKRSVTKKMEEYKGNIPQKAVLWHLRQKGIEVHEGENIFYIYRDFKSPQYLSRVAPSGPDNFRVDYEKYEELFVKATYELINFLPYKLEDVAIAAQDQRQSQLEEFIKLPIKIKESKT